MKTFQEFLELAEKYYAPDDKLPSGGTPVEKAETRAETEYKNTKNGKDRQIRQRIQLNRKVIHGADNPKINRHSQSGLEISGVSGDTNFYHPKTKIVYSVNKHGRTSDGKDVYNVTWNHYHGSDLDSDQRKQVARDARHVWNTHVQHRLPHGSVLKNTPISEPDGNSRKDTRAKLYQRAGFGEVGSRGLQFASVGREPSSKQKAKGKKTRLKPMSGDTTFNYHPNAYQGSNDWLVDI